MRWIRYVAIALVNAFGVVVGIVWVAVPHTLAQSSIDSTLQTYQLQDTTPSARSLPELYKLRDRLKADLNKLTQNSDPTLFPEPWREEIQRQQSENSRRNLQAVEASILIEEEANNTWQQAAKLARQAVEIGRIPSPNAATWERSQHLWQAAIEILRQIPQESFLADKAIEKTIEYQGYVAIATYEWQLARSIEEAKNRDRLEKQAKANVSKTATVTPLSIPSTSVTPPLGFSFLGDTNRDAIIDQRDEQKREKWSLASGALILFNHDDDDRKGISDWQDLKVNGERDVQDLAPITLKLSEEFVGSQIFLTADTASLRHVNIFQKTNDGWRIVDISGKEPLVFDREMVLGVEAKQFRDRNWSGVIALKATAIKNGKEMAADTIQMGVSPWIMSPNTAPVKEIYVSDRGVQNSDFVAQIKQAIEPTDTKTKITPGDSIWLQETKEIGYVQFPDKVGIRTFNSALKRGGDNQSKSLLGRDFGTFEIGQSRGLDPLNQWSDGYGNLEVTPPLAGYPMGRVYYGNSGTATLNPEVVDFIKAQQVQGPPVDIDTSWLLIRNADEIISFIPSNSGQPLLMVVSPEAGVKLLEELAKKGYNDAIVNRDLSTQTTVRAALNNKSLIQHNLYLQQEKINPLLSKLKKEFQLTDDRIIQVPAMFGYSGYAWWPNMVNSVAVNGQLLVSNPRGPMIDGQDYTQEKFRQLVAPSGITVNFLEDKYYHELRGNTHSATNTIRQGEVKPFWEF
ncbi:protein-arginine deiminase family protein [Kamptonema animale CS-326]|jgi:protein-arginine deiminase|uniref:protein-arginine deiminase family protein n=1 Tax=Kamptonema animale TaxID=92934 RepID=UPI00232DE171|nr:protein-arginine deiminase family protein [Kamptonema animale]MDB9514912.1 protein-arginine deiminase family protein [Kamptonema animale CS-326]